jgi:hypothetical protein
MTGVGHYSGWLWRRRNLSRIKIEIRTKSGSGSGTRIMTRTRTRKWVPESCKVIHLERGGSWARGRILEQEVTEETKGKVLVEFGLLRRLETMPIQLCPCESCNSLNH